MPPNPSHSSHFIPPENFPVPGYNTLLGLGTRIESDHCRSLPLHVRQSPLKCMSVGLHGPNVPYAHNPLHLGHADSTAGDAISVLL